MYKIKNQWIKENRWLLLSYCLIALIFAFFLPTGFVPEQDNIFLPNGTILTYCYQHAVDVFGFQFPGKLESFGWHGNNESFYCSGAQW